nr:outer membrane beta-barrel protein [uncultured Arsenicibacter sp.]
MKKSVFALCLLGAGAVYGQTMNSSSTTTTTTTTYDSTNRANNGATMSTPMYNNNTSATGTTTYDNGMNNTGSSNMNSRNSYNSTTTTTTTTSDYNSDSKDRTGTRADGKQGRFGVYAGVNLSRFINEPIPDNAYRAGWQAGIYGRSGGTVFGQIGLEYRNSTSNLVRTGTGTTPGSVANEVRGKIDQHFLAIPAYVGLRVGGVAGLRIQAGAELASLVAIGNNNFQLGKDDLNRTILNGLVGAGVNLGPLTLDAVYNHGFANVFDNGADTKRRLWAFNLGFRF